MITGCQRVLLDAKWHAVCSLYETFRILLAADLNNRNRLTVNLRKPASTLSERSEEGDRDASVRRSMG